MRLGPFEVECRKTWHHIPTTALRFRAGRRTIGHSADTRFDPALIDWLLQSDLVLHETGPGVRTSIEDLEALPREAGPDAAHPLHRRAAGPRDRIAVGAEGLENQRPR